MAHAATEKRDRYFTLDSYKLKNGDQLPGLHQYFSKAAGHGRPRLYLEALVAAHMPQLLVVTPYASLDEIRNEPRPDGEFESLDTTLIEATEYAPATLVSAKSPRLFELRVYHSPTWHQLTLLHARFAGPEIEIFHRVGIHPVLYSSTLIGQHMPNLTYLIPFEDLAAREKAWAAFGADPEWLKVRKESIERGGQISSVMQISLFKSAPYSPIK